MNYKEFGDLKISTLGMGNMRLPTAENRGPIDREKAAEIIEYAYNNGINYFDTAYRYHNGESEEFVGQVLSKFPRDTWLLASKMPGHMMDYKDGQMCFKGYLAGHKASTPADIFEEQLQKCKVDYFDFYLLHNLCESSYDFYTNKELNIVGYLQEQKKLGRIRHFGLSAHGRADTIDKFLTEYEGVFEFVQIQLNYLDWTLQDAKSKYEVAQKHGLPVIVMEPVRGGRLAVLPESADKILKEIRPNASAASWAFRFLQSLPGVQIVLSGMSNMEQIKENIEIFSKSEPITEEEQKALDKVVEAMLNLVPCTACSYCTEECPMGLNIPKLIALYNEETNGGGMLGFNMDKDKTSEMPSACIACGACQRICPQGIDIPGVMKKFEEILSKK